jgi:hypothetical protein
MKNVGVIANSNIPVVTKMLIGQLAMNIFRLNFVNRRRLDNEYLSR